MARVCVCVCVRGCSRLAIYRLAQLPEGLPPFVSGALFSFFRARCRHCSSAPTTTGRPKRQASVSRVAHCQRRAANGLGVGAKLSSVCVGRRRRFELVLSWAARARARRCGSSPASHRTTRVDSNTIPISSLAESGTPTTAPTAPTTTTTTTARRRQHSAPTGIVSSGHLLLLLLLLALAALVATGLAMAIAASSSHVNLTSNANNDDGESDCVGGASWSARCALRAPLNGALLCAALAAGRISHPHRKSRAAPLLCAAGDKGEQLQTGGARSCQCQLDSAALRTKLEHSVRVGLIAARTH